MNTFGIIGAVLIGAIHIFNVIYIGHRLFRWFSYIFPGMNTKIFILWHSIMGGLTMFAMLPLSLPISINYHMRVIGGFITGIYLYILLFFILTDLVLLIMKITRQFTEEGLKKLRFHAGTAALFFGILVAGFGIYNATQIQLTTYELELQRDLQGEMTIVLVSDLHLGEIYSESRLKRVVEKINSLNPDIVTIAGDIFNDDFYAIRNPERAAATLRSIDTTFGVFACLGNHDTGRSIGSMISFLEESNIHLLNCEYVIIDDRLVLIGRLDKPLPWMAEGGFAGMERRYFPDIMDEIRTELQGRYLPIIVIDHNPAHIPEYGNDVDMALFGHTHGGGMFPFNIVTRLLYVIDRGHFQQDAHSPHIIVTQGMHGWSIPLRVGSYNEVVEIIIR